MNHDKHLWVIGEQLTPNYYNTQQFVQHFNPIYMMHFTF